MDHVKNVTGFGKHEELDIWKADKRNLRYRTNVLKHAQNGNASSYVERRIKFVCKRYWFESRQTDRAVKEIRWSFKIDGCMKTESSGSILDDGINSQQTKSDFVMPFIATVIVPKTIMAVRTYKNAFMDTRR